MDTYTLSLYLGVLGILGTLALLIAAGLVAWHYRSSRIRNYRWRWRQRNWRLKQVTAIACLFFLAMAASYAILHEAWGWIYLVAAFKTGVWWLRRAITQRL